jgi:hypothetical protein
VQAAESYTCEVLHAAGCSEEAQQIGIGMRTIAYLVLYLAGGLALYPCLDVLHGVGVSFDRFYSWASIDLGADLWGRLGVCFIYASLFDLVWAAFFSESSDSWTPTVRTQDVWYLFFSCIGYFAMAVVTAGLVGLTTKKVPYTDFHQYFTFLVLSALLGVWTLALKDFSVAIFHYAGRKLK